MTRISGAAYWLERLFGAKTPECRCGSRDVRHVPEMNAYRCLECGWLEASERMSFAPAGLDGRE